MNAPSYALRTIFNEAIEIENPKERAAYLVRVCGEDLGLRRRIEELIQASGNAGEFLNPRDDRDSGTAEIRVVPVTEKAGDRIGRYKLLQQTGEGGCGIVYLADQEEPVHRQVALKLIKLGMDTKSIIARFEAERQALAVMDHPNIAKVFDAGATETGRPYFVMELVQGTRLATVSWDRNAMLGEPRRSSEPQRLKHWPGPGIFCGVAFSPDGRLCAVGGVGPETPTPEVDAPAHQITDAAVHLFDVENLEKIRPVRRFQGHSSMIRSLAFSEDGSQIASASFGGTVKVWLTASPPDHLNLAGHDQSVWATSVSPDGR